MSEKYISKDVSYRASECNDKIDFMVPEENFIKLLIYRGCKRDEINKLARDLNLYPLVASDLDAIITKCRSTKEGRKIVKENQLKLTAGESLYSSDKNRKEFEFPEVYDSMMKLSKDNNLLHGFTNRQLITNSEKRRFLECSILFGLPFKRINLGWKKKFVNELDETEYNQFQYYFWNIGHYNQNKCKALIEKHHKYQFYEDFKYIYGLSQVNFLSYFSIASTEEILNHECNLFRTEEADREDLFYTDPDTYPAKDSQYIRRKKHYNKLLSHLEKAEFWSKQLQRIFSRIVGKVRLNLLRDQIINKRRLNRVPEQDEEYIIRRK